MAHSANHVITSHVAEPLDSCDLLSILGPVTFLSVPLPSTRGRYANEPEFGIGERTLAFECLVSMGCRLDQRSREDY